MQDFIVNEDIGKFVSWKNCIDVITKETTQLASVSLVLCAGRSHQPPRPGYREEGAINN